MHRPILSVVDDRLQDLETIRSELSKRYSADYEIVAEASPAPALARLQELHAAGAQGHRSARRLYHVGADLAANGDGDGTGTTAPPARAPLLLETSLPGVFAAGDVRHGSVKRVAAAVGEGGVAIQSVHQYLGQLK